MSTEEFYIRNLTDTDARGPFNMEQLSSLADNGQVTGESLYYEAATEQWVTVGSNGQLMGQLFPEKRRLTVKAKDRVMGLNTSNDQSAPIEVRDMLAAAEGRSADTKDKADPTEARARAAKLGMYACTLTLLISAAALLAPSVDVIVAGNYQKLLAQPFALLGALDLVLFLLMVLQTVTLYPFIRFRAALGAGFLGLVYWLQGEPTIALAAVAGSLGLYLSTLFTNLVSVMVAVALGLAGMGFFAYAVLTS
jgi:hypothetical protein